MQMQSTDVSAPESGRPSRRASRPAGGHATPPGGRRGGAVGLAFAMLVVVLVVAGCSSSGGTTPASSSPPPSPRSSAPTSSAGALSCPSATASVPVPSTFDATQQAIATNWERFFSKDTPIPAKLCLLQGGAQLTSAVQAFANNPFAAQITAQVTKVDVSSPTSATVTYAIIGAGNVPLLPNATGTAVNEGGTWKVGLTSLCSLLQLANVNLPVCSGASP